MTRFLASIKDIDEAKIASRIDIDIIDMDIYIERGREGGKRGGSKTLCPCLFLPVFV